MTISDRVRQIIEYKGISLSVFNKKISAGTGYVEKLLQRNGTIGSDKLENIVFVFPDINPIWLLTGKGEMLKEDVKTAHSPPPTAPKGGENAPKLHIAPLPQSEDDRIFDRKLTENKIKSTVFSQNETPKFCASCASKEQVISTLNELILQLKGRLKDKEQLIAILTEQLSTETSENPHKHGTKGKQSKTA